MKVYGMDTYDKVTLSIEFYSQSGIRLKVSFSAGSEQINPFDPADQTRNLEEQLSVVHKYWLTALEDQPS